MFFVVVNLTYAYFSSHAYIADINESTGTIDILIQKNIAYTKTSIVNGGESTVTIGTSTTVLPGDTLTLAGTLENKGERKCYAILELIVTAKKTSATTYETIDKLYSFDGYTFYSYDGITLTAYDADGETTALTIEAPNADKDNTYTSDFELSYIFDGNTFDDDYKNSEVKYTLSAYAIQESKIAAETATTKLLENALADD